MSKLSTAAKVHGEVLLNRPLDTMTRLLGKARESNM